MRQSIEVHVIPDVDIATVDLLYDISRLHPLLLGGRSFQHLRHDRRPVTRHSDEDHTEDPCKDQIERRASRNDRHPRPHGLTVKAVRGRVFHIVFPHHARSAEGEQFYTKIRLPELLSEQCRAKAEGELIHPDSVFFGQKEMSELMKDYNKAK